MQLLKELCGAVIVIGLLIAMVAAVYFSEKKAEQRQEHESHARHRAEFEQEAISHNAASYEIADPATGAVEFKWKDE